MLPYRTNILSRKGDEAMEQESKWIREILRHGSRPAADKLIHAHYGEIYISVYRQTGSKEDAMDLTRSIFLAVFRLRSRWGLLAAPAVWLLAGELRCLSLKWRCC